MKKSIPAILLAVCATMLLSACGQSSGDGGSPGTQDNGSLELSEGQYYKIRGSGAIDAQINGTRWENSEDYLARGMRDKSGVRTVVFTGGNNPDKQAVSKLAFVLLEELEPGSYDVTGGANTAHRRSGLNEDEPVKVLRAELRYPGFETVDDEDQVEGTMDVERNDDEGMAGTFDLTLTGEGGAVKVRGIFDAPVRAE